MARWAVPLADVRISEPEIDAISDVYRSGWLSMGPETEHFESELARYLGVQHAVAVANGTAALQLICAAVGLRPGDEVIVPSMTFIATVSAIVHTGASPVFADIVDMQRPWLSAAAVAACIGPRTKAIMAMAYGGHAGDLEDLRELADEHGLLLLEDAAHALGSRWRGRSVGTFGAAGAFSFFSNKNLAIGEGGAVVTDDPELAERVRLLRSHGMTARSWDRASGHASGYDVVALGFNFRIDEPRAALARMRLARLDDDNVARRRLVERYRVALSDLEGLQVALPPAEQLESAHHLFVVVLGDGLDRDAFRAALKDRMIQTSVHYPPIHQFTLCKDTNILLPRTEEYGRRAVTLPLFAHMSVEQQELVVTAIAEATGRS